MITPSLWIPASNQPPASVYSSMCFFLANPAITSGRQALCTFHLAFLLHPATHLPASSLPFIFSCFNLKQNLFSSKCLSVQVPSVCRSLCAWVPALNYTAHKVSPDHEPLCSHHLASTTYGLSFSYLPTSVCTPLTRL